MSLRSKIIRLAYNNEDLRPQLLPLLEESTDKTAVFDMIYEAWQNRNRNKEKQQVEKRFRREGWDHIVRSLSQLESDWTGTPLPFSTIWYVDDEGVMVSSGFRLSEFRKVGGVYHLTLQKFARPIKIEVTPSRKEIFSTFRNEIIGFAYQR